jgi:flavin-dependent dehydrogenase
VVISFTDAMASVSFSLSFPSSPAIASSSAVFPSIAPPEARVTKAGVDVLVVGAGPAGSATTWHLARQGYRVVAVDRATFPREKACSEYMSPEAVRLLDRLGVVPSLEAAGASPLYGTTVIGPAGSRLTGLFARAGVTLTRNAGFSIARRILDQQLADAARSAGGEVLDGVGLEALLYENGAVGGAVLRDAWPQADNRARLTIGADGLRSVVARRIGRGLMVDHHGWPSSLMSPVSPEWAMWPRCMWVVRDTSDSTDWAKA